jgi:lipoprotein-anchoring transpeptidase ErfK/SrfK
MRGRGVFLGGCLLCTALAGALMAGALATASPAQTPPPPPPPTTTTPPPQPPPPPPPQPPPADVIPSGVTVGGVHVGGMLRDQAYQEVSASFGKPLVLVLGRHRFVVSPSKLRTRALLRLAVGRAHDAEPGTAVRLPVRIRGASVRSYVRRLGERFDRDPVDARLLFRRYRPWVTRHRPGRKLDQLRAVKAIVGALTDNRREPIRLRFREVRPRETRRSLARPVIVIHRESRVLRLYKGMRLWRTFGVAVGQSSYPTPIGLFEIVVMWRNPWWYPPNSDWARGSSPIPPGPGNPLGTRWMGLSASGVGIHGTPDAASIGYSASHGCIRMHIPSAEWLFNHVSIGTPVYIVPA